MPINLTRQLHVVHLTDLHFGPDHRFAPPRTVMGEPGPRAGFPTLLTKLAEDLQEPKVEDLIFCITGDFTTTAIFDEYDDAEKFVTGLADTEVCGARRGMKNVFMVPGNHDVNYTSPKVGERWERYTGFYNRLYGTTHRHDQPLGMVQLHDRTADLGALVLTLNSCVYVEKGKKSEQQGMVDYEQLGTVEKLLKAVPPDGLRNSIRIALIHHHPVLIPALAEPSRSYDAVENAGLLLSLLRQYGFQLVLHGHKHSPFVFTEDSSSAWSDTPQPIVIAAGGSAGSTGLPTNYSRNSNCYNRITVKYYPDGGQTRVQVQTRGLTIFKPNGAEDLPHNWRWVPLKVEDKSFSSQHCVPEVRAQIRPRTPPPEEMRVLDQARAAEYQKRRGNMPVVEVKPSLVRGQAYEARCWVVGHGQREVPVRVTWSAGRHFPVITIAAEDDGLFCVEFHYWGPMLIEACMEFADGGTVRAHVYARLPEAVQAEEAKPNG
ncbi:MAG: metallophosphoesterase [Bryobacteraceae bacterium]|nr:metallophosphoesterase [Bryobacteraceae bacterium]